MRHDNALGKAFPNTVRAIHTQVNIEILWDFVLTLWNNLVYSIPDAHAGHTQPLQEIGGLSG